MSEVSLSRAFALQGSACSHLGSPFTGQLCALFAERWTPRSDAVAERLFDWDGDVTSAGDNLPLRLAGALHHWALTDRDAGLKRCWPPHTADADAIWDSVSRVLKADAQDILAFCRNPPQTNEVGRSAALMPVLLTLAARFAGLPLALFEVGASAGLNLCLDRWGYRLGGRVCGDADSALQLTPQWRGAPLGAGFEGARLHIAERRGCDIAPIDVRSEAGCARLMSYIWPDQRERLERTRSAVEIARSLDVRLDTCGAGEWLEQRLTPSPGEQLRVVYSTVAWQYFSRADQQRGRDRIRRIGEGGGDRAPLAWLRVEADEASQRGQGAAIILALWCGGASDGVERELGRADFHGRWVEWGGASPGEL
ncbi:MAG: DUF2332 family protein [Gammaproteobacteria bacterium AqS3]|nr:DUF2332 family protein [Gammaproteobacteria bacterium AqS3]